MSFHCLERTYPTPRALSSWYHGGNDCKETWWVKKYRHTLLKTTSSAKRCIVVQQIWLAGRLQFTSSQNDSPKCLLSMPCSRSCSWAPVVHIPCTLPPTVGGLLAVCISSSHTTSKPEELSSSASKCVLAITLHLVCCNTIAIYKPLLTASYVLTNQRAITLSHTSSANQQAVTILHCWQSVAQAISELLHFFALFSCTRKTCCNIIWHLLHC